jgi:hypothetical protein
MSVMSSSTAIGGGNLHNDNYRKWLEDLGAYFKQIDGPIFQTVILPDTLWETYLEGFADPVVRQFHNCSCCKQFIRRYGGLALISDKGGEIRPALWTPYVLTMTNDYYPELVPSLTKLASMIRNSSIFGVFLSEEGLYGTPQTNQWAHMHVRPTPDRVYRNKVKTAFQAMAEKTEEYRTVSLFLSEYTRQQLEQAAHICDSDVLYRSEKVQGQALWLVNLKDAVEGTKNTQAKKNIIWKAVAEAPAGFCHPRASMINTLLEDLQQLSVEEAAAAFKRKMNPIVYQRPQAAPTAGNIKRGEELVEKLGIRKSLERRFLTYDEITAMWRPESRSVQRRVAVQTDTPTPVFGDLIPKGSAPARHLKGLGTKMTWVKFRDTVLHKADRIQFVVPTGRHSFGVLVTAVDAEAPPIIQWDFENNRNPVSWYVWHGGSAANEFSLRVDSLVDVTAVVTKPCYWTIREGMEHQGEGVLFVLEGAKDTKNSGNGLFPEILKNELREVRSTIEAYSRKQKVQPSPDGTMVAGMWLFKDHGDLKVELVVTAKGIQSTIKIDRWD